MRQLFLWGPPLLWMGLIFALSAQPELPTPQVAFLDKVSQLIFHFGEYAVLVTLLLRARLGGLHPPYQPLDRRARLLALLVAAAYALSDEYHQSFVPGRTASWFDVAADWAGAVSAILFVMAILRGRGS